MECCINALKMVDVHGKITLKPFILLLGWKCSKSFELGLEEVWEREYRSNNDVDEASLMNRSCYLTAGSVSGCLHKEF